MPVRQIKLSRAGPADIETLVRMRIALLQEVGNKDAESDTEDISDAIRHHFKEELSAGRYVAFIAHLEGHPVGTGGLTFYVRPPYKGNASGKEAYLMGMYTVADCRGKGIGSALLNKLLEFAKACGVGRVWLHTEPGAKRMYEKAGFRPNQSYMELVW